MSVDTKTILLADDDEAIVDATMLMLEVMGYNVVHTVEGKAITTIAQDHPQPDLILLDIWMSGIDGREVCRELKSNPSTKHIPVLMISASRDIGQSSLDAGADAFVEKPFEMNVILEKIEALLS